MLRMQIGISFLALVLTGQAAAADELAVIVNVANTTAALDAKAVKAHFLKTLSSWSNGDRVRPVDQSDATAKRAAFLAKVLGMSANGAGAVLARKAVCERRHPAGQGPR